MLGVAESVQEVLQDGFSIPGDQIVDRLSFSPDGQLLAVASLVRDCPACNLIHAKCALSLCVLMHHWKVFQCTVPLVPFSCRASSGWCIHFVQPLTAPAQMLT